MRTGPLPSRPTWGKTPSSPSAWWPSARRGSSASARCSSRHCLPAAHGAPGPIETRERHLAEPQVQLRAGIGLFLAFIGLYETGIVTSGAAGLPPAALLSSMGQQLLHAPRCREDRRVSRFRRDPRDRRIRGDGRADDPQGPRRDPHRHGCDGCRRVRDRSRPVPAPSDLFAMPFTGVFTLSPSPSTSTSLAC